MQSLMVPPALANILQTGTEVSGCAPRSNSTTRFYDDNAARYARSTRSMSLEPEIRRFAVEVAAGGRVLDAGCGAGRDLRALRRAGLHPTGLELSPKLAELARAYSGCEVTLGDMRDPPFSDRSFDGVWAAASLLHLELEEVVPTLTGLRRLLEPGGVLFTSVKMGIGTELSSDGRLFTYFAPDQWASLVGAAGLEEIEIRTEPLDNRSSKPRSGWIQSWSRAG
jgi:SAM-dependent methyltransferase